MPLRYLFVDMNAYFASVEKQDDPTIRGRPVAVVPVLADSTCAIAACYQAKRYGVRTGTPVWEMKRLCPGIVIREARPTRYVHYHRRLVEAVERCLPVEKVMSIDEMCCRLVGDERDPANAWVIGRAVQRAVRRVGEALSCSVGIGPNVTLAKVASDMKKPAGLTVIDPDDLPGRLYPLKLTDMPGIGPRMERRFHRHGVTTMRQLCALTPAQLCHVWGSRVHGWAWWYKLRGEDVPDKRTVRRTVGHSHVLPPDLRNEAGAKGVLVRLLHKAAARLRAIDYWAGKVTVTIEFEEIRNAEFGMRNPGAVRSAECGVRSEDEEGDPGGVVEGGEDDDDGEEPGGPLGVWDAGPGGRVEHSALRDRSWVAWRPLNHVRDTLTLLRAVGELWAARPAGTPLKVGVVLSDLVPARSATPSLFDGDRRWDDVSRVMDEVNDEFGATAIYFGTMWGMLHHAPTRIAFTQIPDVPLKG